MSLQGVHQRKYLDLSRRQGALNKILRSSMCTSSVWTGGGTLLEPKVHFLPAHSVITSIGSREQASSDLLPIQASNLVHD